MSTHRLLRLPSAALAPTLFALALAGDAHAVGSRFFRLDTQEELTGGELKGVAVSSDGVVRAGLSLGTTPLANATSVFASLALPDGSVLVATGPEGKVFRMQQDQASVYAETGELAVTALVSGPKGVFAATIPNGKVFRLSQGKAELYATLPGAEHVWALAYDKGMASLFAATGPEGKIFRVGPNGAPSVYWKSDEPHIVSLAVDETSGDVLAGSSGKAILYRIKGPGRATVLADFPGDEVKAISVAKGGAVWAIANEYADPPDPPKRNNVSAGRSAPGPSSAPRPKPGKGSLYRVDADGRSERLMNSGEFHYTALTLDERGTPYVGTGAEGRVYTVDDHHATAVVADTDERGIGALGITRGAPQYVVGADPAVFHRVIGIGGRDAVWTSKVFDAGLRARFGAISWRGSGPVQVSTRTGNTASPDETWSAWSRDLSSPGPSGSPAGRYVQVRARWAGDANATLADVVVPFVTDNLRPVVLEVSAAQRGGVRETKEGVDGSGADAPHHESVVHVTWKVDNPDSDNLRYRLSFRREGERTYREVHRESEVVTKSEYDWDTAALPEGRYRIRVEASDEPSNPPEQTLKHDLESAPVWVDHAPPTFASLVLQGRKLRGRVTDGLGPIARVEVAVDGRLEWRPLAPADGVFDTADEALDADLAPLVPAGSHLVTVRAFDAAGNFVVRELDAK